MIHLQETHEPWDETVPGPFEYVQETGKEGCTNSETNSPTLDKIGKEEQGCCFVESMLFFQNECLVP